MSPQTSRETFCETMFAAASREFQMVAACCAWPATPARCERLDALLAQPVQWKVVLRLAERHRVIGMLHAALDHRDDVPDEVTAELFRRTARITRENLLSVAVSKQVADALTGDAIPFVVLKGAPLSQLAFGSATLRHSRDIDILLDASHVQQAERALETLGFRRVSLGAGLTAQQTNSWMRYRKHFEYVQSATGVRLEMHWRPFDNALLANVSIDPLQWVDLGATVRLPVLPPVESLLYLCVHGAAHAWFRLKWIADVAALLQQADAPSTADLLALARARGIDRPVEQALLLCAALFDMPWSSTAQPNSVLQNSKTARWLALIARDALLTESTSSASTEADFAPRRLATSRMALRRGWRYRVEETRVYGASPADWQTLRLPSWLHGAYPLLRVPLWVKRRTFPRKGHAKLRNAAALANAAVSQTSSLFPLGLARLVRSWLLLLPVQLLLDGMCGALAITLAYGLRFDMAAPGWARTQMLWWAPLLFVLDPLVIFAFGGYKSSWQYFGLRDLRSLAQRLALLSVALLLLTYFSPIGHLMPYGIVVFDWVLLLFFTGGTRALLRIQHEAKQRVSADERILVVGTAETIAGIIRQLQPLYGDCICGAVLDDDRLQDRNIHGVSVLGNLKSLGSLILDHSVNLLFLCSADLEDLPGLMEVASSLDVPIKFLPSMHDLIDERVRVSKPVTVSALQKGRSDASLAIDDTVIKCLQGKTVLVTGAGGSIGSELVRQVTAAPIRKLILLDQDENAVFELMAELGSPSHLQPVIADIRDREALQSLFTRERPEIVLHAAAYKHVPMMENNPCEAVLNNVYGTRMLAETALAFRAERLVMISSDKAVRPSSVMGATKRTAESVIQQIAQEAGMSGEATTEFACVRFGNVLGSRGSVLPMFLKQIEQGGPVTVTHEEMTRYFMTIPQAVHLVLQAATLGSQGHIYMLDMGDPVLIMNFAREVIQLAGLTPGKDIEIRIVGSRPGEKLHEQLWLEDAQVSPTSFEYIFQVRAEAPDSTFPHLLHKLEEAAHQHRSDAIRDLLRQLPIDYLTERAAVTEGENSSHQMPAAS